MKLFNSLTRNLEDFKPITRDSVVSIYTCGPTVYSYVTIGNWRTYTLGDILVRALQYLGHTTKYVMNITDVGHLTGDNLGDADTGEDRLEKAAKKEGKTAWDVAEFYTRDFLQGYDELGLLRPFIFCKATDHIQEQIDLVKTIEERGFAYKISDGIYFDTAAYEAAGNVYGELSTLDQIREGARVDVNEEKKDPRDFALWKFSPVGTKRDMEWESPWGMGFPGWHIECSAMGMKYLGEQFDLHLGGEDLRSTHHPNEIAQSEAATTKKPFVRYWMHGAFLLVDGGRMGKSLGNAFTLADVKDRGFSPLALRYFYMTGHYRKPLNFTWEGLEAASVALNKLYEQAMVFGAYTSDEEPQPSDVIKSKLLEFKEALEEDLNMPKALAALHSGLQVAETDSDTFYLLGNVDPVLGLNLVEEGKRLHRELQQTNLKFKALLEEREMFRKEKNWAESDRIRREIEAQGFEVEDTDNGSMVRKK